MPLRTLSFNKFRFLFAGLAVVLVSVGVGLSVAVTYYYSDDFFLMTYALQVGPSLGHVLEPVYGHCVPGMLWLYYALGKIGGLSRLPAVGLIVGFFVLLLLSVRLFLGVSVVSSGRQREAYSRLWLSSGLSLITAVAAIPAVYLARGIATLPLAVCVVLSAALLIAAVRRDRLSYTAIAAVLSSTGLLFWELAALNALAIPALAAASLHAFPSSPQGPTSRLRSKATRRHAVVWVGITLGAVALYAHNYSQRGYGAGTGAPDVYEAAKGLSQWIVYALLPALGGGPVPTAGAVLGISGPGMIWPQTVLPLVLGVAIGGITMLIPKVRWFLVVLFAVGLAQGAVLVHARLTLDGGFFHNLRYVADMLPYYVVTLAVLWTISIDWLFDIRLARADDVKSDRGTCRHWLDFGSQGFVSPLVTALLICALGISLWTWISITDRFGGQDRNAYIQTSAASVEQLATGITVLAGPLSPAIGYVPAPFDNTKEVLFPEIGRSRWNVGTSVPVLIDARGLVSRPAIDNVVSSEANASTLPCQTSAMLPDQGLPSGPLRTVEIAVEASSSGSNTVIIGNDSYEQYVVAGVSLIRVQTYSAPTTIRLESMSGSSCILKARAFVASPQSGRARTQSR